MALSLLLQRWVDDDLIILPSKTTVPLVESLLDFDCILGVSNGLFCCAAHVYGLGWFLYLCNPSTRKYRRIPQQNFLVRLDGRCFGFCFNSKDNDYKILQLDAFGSVHMFSLRSGSWKKIGLSNCECEFSSYNLSVNVSGCMFWMAKRDKESCVLSFDTESEEREMFGVPSYNEGAKMKLGVYENSLALIVDSVTGPSHLVDLWVLDGQQRNSKLSLMQKSNPNLSYSGFLGNHWKKILTVDHASIWQNPLGVWQNELLFPEGQFIYGQRGFKFRVCLFRILVFKIFLFGLHVCRELGFT